jgi:dihydroorotate dehydrogenase
MLNLYPFLRPLLFQLDAEDAHRLTLGLAGKLGRLMPGAPAATAPTRVMGLDFANRIGLAAGLDKNAEAIDFWFALGFGHIEVGTVTPRPQPGNPRPRLFRLPEARGIINRMGFNNDGIDALLDHVAQSRRKGILGINIGKNADTPIERALDDYRTGLAKAYRAADYITVNISSPNTKNLRDLQGPEALDALLGGLKADQAQLTDQHGKYTPIAIKIAPDLDAEQITMMAELFCHHRIDAVIATNTTLAREGVAGLPHSDETGGLSGAPVFAKSTQVLAAFHQAMGDTVPLIGAGGVFSGADAQAKLTAGASLVQIYSGLIYRGTRLLDECLGSTAKH